MSVKTFSAFLALSFLFASQALCGPSTYLVTLKNGSTLTVDSYNIKGRKLAVNYPLGSAELELSSVRSITGGDGKTDLFSDKGEQVTPNGSASHEKRDGRPAAASTPLPVPETIQAEQGAPGDKKASGNVNGTANIFGRLAPDPRAGEINSFIDTYFNSDEKQRETADLDKVFSSYFEDDTDQVEVEDLK